MTSLPADPIAAVVHSDPYPYYAALAATDGATWHEDLRLWVVASTPEVNEVLEDPDCRVRPVAEPVPLALAGTADDVDAASVAATALCARFDEANAIGLLIQSAHWDTIHRFTAPGASWLSIMSSPADR